MISAVKHISHGPNKLPGMQSFEIYAVTVTIEISMTEHYRLMVYSNTAAYGGK